MQSITRKIVNITAAIIGCSIVAGWSEEVCPGTTYLPSNVPQDSTYRCMKSWDPCRKAPDANYPTWPILPEGNELWGPMYGRDVAVPAVKTGYFQEFCLSENLAPEGKLKPEWVVFDRNLFKGDADPVQGIPQSSLQFANSDDDNRGVAESPYFALYNKYTGDLRTFIFIHKKTFPANTIYATASFEGNYEGQKIPTGFGLFENGSSSGLALSKAGTSGFNGWSRVLTSSTQNTFWLVLDHWLPYNIWDDRKYDHEDLYLRYQIAGESTTDLTVSGSEIITNGLSSPPEGLMGAGYTGVSAPMNKLGMGSVALLQGSQAISGALHKDWMNFSCSKASECSGFNLLKLQGKSWDIDWQKLAGSNLPVGDWISQGLNLAAGPALGAAVNGLLFNANEPPKITWSTSQISLNGTLKTTNNVNDVFVPISRRNKNNVPLFAKGFNGFPRSNSELGVFNLLNPPMVHVRPLRRYNDGQYFATLAYYEIADPTCDIVVNPSSGLSLVSIKQALMKWNAKTNEWEPLEDKMMTTYEASRKPYFLGEIKRNFSDEWVLGVNLAVQFAYTDEYGVSKPVLIQKVFEAEVEYVDNGDISDVHALDTYREAPNMPKLSLCTVKQGLNKAWNTIERQIETRRTSFELFVETSSEDYSRTDEPVSVTLVPCNEQLQRSIVMNLDIPGYDDLEKGDAVYYQKGEWEAKLPIKTVRFALTLPKADWFSKASWGLKGFSLTQRDIESGEVLSSFDAIMNPTVLAGILEPWTLKWVGAESYPGVSFLPPNRVVYSYTRPDWELECATKQARESGTPLISDQVVLAKRGGQEIEIAGEHFGRNKDVVSLLIGGKPAQVLRVIPEMITAMIPEMQPGNKEVLLKIADKPVNTDRIKLSISSDIEMPPTTPPTVGPRPSFLTFDENPSTWHSNETSLTPDAQVKVGNSGYGLAINGSDYRVVRSPRFCASELKTYGSKLAVDVYIPSNPGNPWWLGEVALFVDAPSAGVYNSWQGNVQITGLTPGAWHSVEIPLNVQALSALAGSSCDVELGLVLNASAANEPYRFDNLRFTGSELKSADAPVVTNPPAFGTGASFVCTGTCLQAEQAGGNWSSMTLNTMGEKWYVLSTKPAGWQASEIAGRALSINGITVSAGDAFPAAAGDGKWYLMFGAGEHAWASWSHW